MILPSTFQKSGVKSRPNRLCASELTLGWSLSEVPGLLPLTSLLRSSAPGSAALGIGSDLPEHPGEFIDIGSVIFHWAGGDELEHSPLGKYGLHTQAWGMFLRSEDTKVLNS